MRKEKMGTTEKKDEEPAKDGEEKKDEKKMSRKKNQLISLNNIDLQIKKGEFVCVIGKVGSGKSSLLSAMIGDLLPVPE